jgi:hypothetical protein
VAAELRKDDLQVKMIRGKLGELRITVDGEDVYTGNRLLYPRSKTVVTAVRAWLSARAG